MSEPIHLFDKDGNPVTRYSPAMAWLEVAAGMLFTSPPATPNVDDVPELDGMPQDDEQPTRLAELPDDDEPVPVAKRGRPRKVTGQIL